MTPMIGKKTLNPSDRGTTKKWKFKNETGEPIYDFLISTGPKSLFEIEFPWGESGNPPDLRRFTIREDGFDTASKEFDDVTDGKATLDPPIAAGKDFEIEMEFDDEFEPAEYVELIPTDRNGVTIEDGEETTTSEPNTGIEQILKLLGQAAGSLTQLNIPPSELKAALRFNEATGGYVLSMRQGKVKKAALQVVHLQRDRIEVKATYGLTGSGKKKT